MHKAYTILVDRSERASVTGLLRAAGVGMAFSYCGSDRPMLILTDLSPVDLRPLFVQELPVTHYRLGWLDRDTGLFGAFGALPLAYACEMHVRTGIRLDGDLFERLRQADLRGELSEAAHDLLAGQLEVGEVGQRGRLEVAFLVSGALLSHPANFVFTNKGVIDLASAAARLGRADEYLAVYLRELSPEECVQAAQAEGQVCAPVAAPTLAFSMTGELHEGSLDVGPRLWFSFATPQVGGHQTTGLLDITGMRVSETRGSS